MDIRQTSPLYRVRSPEHRARLGPHTTAEIDYIRALLNLGLGRKLRYWPKGHNYSVNILRRNAPHVVSLDLSRTQLIPNRERTLVRGRPLWVISRHVQCMRSCPLYPRKRHQMRHMECPLRANSGHSLLRELKEVM